MVNLLSFMLGIVNFGSFHVGGFSCFDGASVEFLPFRNQQSSGKQARDQHSAGHVYGINETYKDKRKLTSLSSGSMSIDQPTTGVLRYDGVLSSASLSGSPVRTFVSFVCFVRPFHLFGRSVTVPWSPPGTPCVLSSLFL